MLFHSWTFLVFFVVVYAVYWTLNRLGRHQLNGVWLLAASYLFYAGWSSIYLVLIIFSTLVDFAVVQQMSRSRRRGWWLFVSLATNLGLLAFFKYSGFVVDNANFLLDQLGAPFELTRPEQLWISLGQFELPVGISFYTFQSMSYTIDYYRERLEKEDNIVRFAAYVSLFPNWWPARLNVQRHFYRNCRHPR